MIANIIGAILGIIVCLVIARFTYVLLRSIFLNLFSMDNVRQPSANDLIHFVNVDLVEKFDSKRTIDTLARLTTYFNTGYNVKSNPLDDAYTDLKREIRELEKFDATYYATLSEKALQSMAWLKAFTNSHEFDSLDKSQAAQNAVINALCDLTDEAKRIKQIFLDDKHQKELRTKSRLTDWATEYNKMHDKTR